VSLPLNSLRKAGFWRKWLFRLPALAGAGLLAFSALQIAWNASIGDRWPALSFHMKYPMGYVPGAGAAPTMGNLLHGVFQKNAAARIGVQSMLYRSAIRWKHQAYWSLLGMSGVPNILVGKGGQLIETAYVDAYCRRNLMNDRPSPLAWAERIRALQDEVEARGQKFLYLITPSKVALHPEFLPDGFPCATSRRSIELLARFRGALRTAGVHFVDGPAVLHAALGRYDLDLYPRGGIHWNMIGAALTAQAVIAALDNEGAQLTPFSFTSHVNPKPTGWDRDLQEILNLQYEVAYPVPDLDYVSRPPASCEPDRIAEIAGSFIFELNEALEHTACPPEIRPYFYWKNLTTRSPDGALHKQPEDPAERRRDILDWANFVILEENESAGPGAEHAVALMDFMRPNAQAQR